MLQVLQQLGVAAYSFQCSNYCSSLVNIGYCKFILLLQLVTADGSQTDSMSHSRNADNMVCNDAVRERTNGIGNSCPPSFQ